MVHYGYSMNITIDEYIYIYIYICMHLMVQAPRVLHLLFQVTFRESTEAGLFAVCCPLCRGRQAARGSTNEAPECRDMKHE